MCPPFTPSANEFGRLIRKYRRAILVQVEDRIPMKIRRTLSDDESRYSNLIKDSTFLSNYNRWHLNVWMNLHKIVSEIEREAFRRNYYLSLGLGAGECALCQQCEVEKPCKRPLDARPSMEAVGIDVYRTVKNAGLKLEWNRRDAVTLNGLVLIS
jgi:predicted metal-binding protein